MTQPKQRAVVICPGRGTYNKTELGYLQRHHAEAVAAQQLLATVDEYRQQQQQPTVSELDAMQNYNLKLHTAGEHASALIYSCAMADYAAIDQDKYDIVAVTGNSMGWYVALAAAAALPGAAGIEVINTMGSMMKHEIIGGQMIYPLIDEQWQLDPSKVELVKTLMAEVNQIPQAQVYTSIKLGGYLVLGGNAMALDILQQKLPPIDQRYPMKLFNHAAFHTPLLNDIAKQAQKELSFELFQTPALPLIDGQGHIWQPYSTDVYSLHNYTLGAQINSYYDFSAAIEVAIKEFAPDKLIILGPGTSLGGAVAQTLVQHRWQGISNKQDFVERQQQDPFILSMGIEQQRQQVIK